MNAFDLVKKKLFFSLSSPFLKEEEPQHWTKQPLLRKVSYGEKGGLDTYELQVVRD